MTLTRRSALLALAALPAACSSPDPALYALAAEPGPTRSVAAKIVRLRLPSIPHYLERSQIVRSSEGYRMDVLPNDWWGEPLDAMLGRILVENLNQRLPGSIVYGDTGAISATPDATVEVNLQRFDLGRDGAAVLAAQIAIDGPRHARRGVRIAAAPGDASAKALVAALSHATAELADAIAGML
jgi:uncharacterized lipoprotein YmbA